MKKVNLKRQSISGMVDYLIGLGLKSYRPSQITRWIYQKGATSFFEMTDLTKDEREILDREASMSSIELIKSNGSIDGTCKFLLKLEDGNLIESVLIPEEDRLTYCISTQVGCAMGCRFCLTGMYGFKRNLYPDEIVDQIIFARGILPKDVRLTNIVMMGMGEPLANAKNVFKAIDTITDKDGLAISPRRITLSTAGIIPGLVELGRQKSHINLAVSLNATTDGQRSYLMPINRRYPLSDLISTLKRYPMPPRGRITLEYILLKGINDSLEDAIRLAGLVKGIRCKINLIPFNACPDTIFERPDEETILRFQQILIDRHLTAFIRKSKGNEISAACGQLGAEAA